MDGKYNQSERIDISAEAICLDFFAAASNPVKHLAALHESFDSMYQNRLSDHHKKLAEDLVSWCLLRLLLYCD